MIEAAAVADEEAGEQAFPGPDAPHIPAGEGDGRWAGTPKRFRNAWRPWLSC